MKTLLSSLFIFLGVFGIAQAQTLLDASSQITGTNSKITEVERVSCPVFSTATTMHREKGTVVYYRRIYGMGSAPVSIGPMHRVELILRSTFGQLFQMH